MRRPLGLAGQLVLCLLLGSPSADAAEPFYERLLRDGTVAYTRGDDASAIRSLRIACFGLLDQPESLASCRVYLALAQARAGDQDGFVETFDKILEVERRFQGFSRLELAPELRQDFEGHLQQLVPYQVYAGEPAFRSLAQRVLEARILALPPAERLEELRRRLAADPGQVSWQLMLAELELAAGNFEAAAAAAGAVLARDAQQIRATCVRGRAAIALGECEAALEELEACGEEVVEELAQARLECLVQVEDWRGADVLLSEMPYRERQRGAIKKLAKQVKRGLRSPDAGSAAVEAMSAEADPVAPPQPAEAAAADPPPAIDVSGQAPRTASRSSDDPLAAELPATGAAPGRVATDRVATDRVATDRVATDRVATDRVATDRVATDRQARMQEAREVLRSSSDRAEIERTFQEMRSLADQYFDDVDLQYLVAEISFRLRRWSEVVAYFERGGDSGPEQPDQQFYLAVALYETGDRVAAARTLDRCLPYLSQTEFVRRYSALIRDGTP